MKRRVIQIANSTQLISLPRKWCLEHGIKKGDELEIEIDTGKHKLIVSTDHKPDIERVEFASAEFSNILTRYIHGLYKRGVDEIKMHFKDSKDLARVQKSLVKDVGFEIVEQGANYCIIRNISGEIEGFDQVLRRIFMLLLNMADEGLKYYKQNQSELLLGLLPLEEANNRFTISCRRYLNKKGHPDLKIGPMYYVVESLEKIADEYKDFYQYLAHTTLPPALKKEITVMLAEVNLALRNFIDCFYKFDAQKLVYINDVKDRLMQKWRALGKGKHPIEQLVYTHYVMMIGRQVADFTGSLIAKK